MSPAVISASFVVAGIALMAIAGLAGTTTTEIVAASVGIILLGAVVYFGARILGIAQQAKD